MSVVRRCNTAELKEVVWITAEEQFFTCSVQRCGIDDGVRLDVVSAGVQLV